MIAAALWTVVNLAGAAVVVVLLREALLDRRALDKAQVVNGRRVVARANVRNNAVRLAVMTFFTLIGVVALTRPLVPEFAEVFGTLIRAGLVVGAVLLTWDAWMDRRMLKSMWPRRGR